MAVYDSGGKKKDHKKYKENYEKIFNGTWPCPVCEGTRAKGHTEDCPHHWKNK